MTIEILSLVKEEIHPVTAKGMSGCDVEDGCQDCHSDSDHDCYNPI